MRNFAKVLATAVLAVSALAVPSAAVAANNCSDWKTKDARPMLPDLYGVGAKCSSLNNDKKARGGLDVIADIDVHTAWFTTKNKSYYSSSKRASVRGTYHTIRSI